MKSLGTLVGSFVVALAILGSGCSSASTPDHIVLLTHDSFALTDDVLSAFTDQTGVEVIITTAGDAGSMVNQAILTKDNPIADVIFGVDNAFLSRAIANDLFAPHRATDIDTVPTSMRVKGDMATPITFGDVCLNYDLAAFEDLGLAVPQDLGDLTGPDYAGQLVVEDPATSSPGLAFLLATIATYPEGGTYDWHDYWTDLFDNDVAVASDWSDAYYSQFTMAGGDRPLVVSYASSPPAEVFYGETATAPTAAVTFGCFRQIEYAGVLAGTDHAATAGQLVDFLLSVEVQEDIPLNMFVYPTNTTAALPQVFVDNTAFPDEPIIIDPAVIDTNRERWITEWTAIARS